jgi:uncharacterized iron-regulated membrane protein
LALPEHIAIFGVYVLGIAALFWFFDCFISYYLTFPSTKKRIEHAEISSRSFSKNISNFWQRWKPSWQIKYSRMNYDLHRAFGLWIWILLLILAWSGVAFNLKEVYQPVMSTAFNIREDNALPKLNMSLDGPILDWRTAQYKGRQYIKAAASQHGFTVELEQSLALNREQGIYYYRVKSNQDNGKYGTISALIDANTGDLISLRLPHTESVGDIINRWITDLHTARIFGLPMQILICITGVIVVILSVSGLLIWYRKRNINKHQVLKKTIRNSSI